MSIAVNKTCKYFSSLLGNKKVEGYLNFRSRRKSRNKSEISAMRKNQRPYTYTYVGMGRVENGHMVGVGWVLHTDYAQSYKIVNFYVS